MGLTGTQHRKYIKHSVGVAAGYELHMEQLLWLYKNTTLVLSSTLTVNPYRGGGGWLVTMTAWQLEQEGGGPLTAVVRTELRTHGEPEVVHMTC